MLTGVGLVGWWMLRPGSIRDAAQQYLRALETGDLDTIHAMMADLPVGPAQRATIDDAFTGASGHISSARIDDIGPDGGVRATAQLGGSPTTVFFMMANSGRLSGDVLGTLTVHPSIGDAVRIGDATVLSGATVSLLPAVYPVTALPNDILDGSRSVAVSNDAPNTAELDVSLSPHAVEAVAPQLNAYEDGCAAATDAVPAHCGLRVPWAADLRTLKSLAFHIDKRPVLALADDAASFAATAGRITATARGQGWDGTSRTVTYGTDEWALRGRLVFDGARVQLRVD